VIRKPLIFSGSCQVDPKVPIEKTIELLGQLVKGGNIRDIQLSEVEVETIRRAATVHRIDMVEEVSLWAKEIFSNGVAETCTEPGALLDILR